MMWQNLPGGRGCEATRNGGSIMLDRTSDGPLTERGMRERAREAHRAPTTGGWSLLTRGEV